MVSKATLCPPRESWANPLLDTGTGIGAGAANRAGNFGPKKTGAEAPAG